MNLLMDYTGRVVNGVGGFLVTALTLDGNDYLVAGNRADGATA